MTSTPVAEYQDPATTVTRRLAPIISPLTLNVDEVATLLGYFLENGQPNRLKIYKLARDGVIPPAIAASKLSCRDWRWSRTLVESWIGAGTE